MSFGFLNLAMLFALAAVAIPLLIHLLHRRRFQVVDWGAMQFLLISTTTRRRLWLEELLLLALRMGLIALVVLALAGPYASAPWLENLGRSPRDIVVVIDGSASMGLTDGSAKSTPSAEAADWVQQFVAGLGADDRLALIVGRGRGILVGGGLTQDRASVLAAVKSLPGPRGACSWPRVVDDAIELLQGQEKHGQPEIILVRDRQKFGWADLESLEEWEKVAGRLQGLETASPATSGKRPRLWSVVVGPEKTKDLANYSLAPLRGGRLLARVGQNLRFHSALRFEGMSAYQPPRRVHFEVDGKPIEDLALPKQTELARGQIPLTFAYRFSQPGVHLVSLVVQPDDPPEMRTADYRVRDVLAADNRQDLAVQVVGDLPVLVVDGSNELSPESPSYFLAWALKSSRPSPTDPAGSEEVRTVLLADFTPSLLAKDAAKSPRPRVLILADVPRLSDEQRAAVAAFLADGGGGVVVLGERVEAAYYNEQLYQDGQGWLPARLERAAGEVGRPDLAAAPDVRRFFHPALELFQDPQSPLGKTRFVRWWRVQADDKSIVGAFLTSGDPLFVEKTVGQGKVLLCAVPFDRSWESSLTRTWEFPLLVNELVGFLAETRAIAFNVTPGQPLQYQPDASLHEKDKLPARLVLHPPEAKPVTFSVERWPWLYGETHEAGVYRLEREDGTIISFVVQADPRESDLTPWSAEENKKVAEMISLEEYAVESFTDLGGAGSPTRDLWWLLLIGVMAFLCLEIWLTRRMALSRGNS